LAGEFTNGVAKIEVGGILSTPRVRSAQAPGHMRLVLFLILADKFSSISLGR
jgi:hypothetical protein